MTQREIERAEKSPSSNLIPSELALARRKRMAELIKLQTELLAKLQESNRQWFDRAQSEANPEFYGDGYALSVERRSE